MFTLFFLSFVFSCEEAETISDIEYADILIKDVEYYLSQGNGNRIKFNASEMTLYSSKNNTILTDASFVQLNSTTKKEMIKGKADYADIDLKSYICNLVGDVEIDITESGNRIYSSDIFWDKEKESIQTDGDIIIEYDDILIDAIGLKGDLKTGEFTIQKIINGRIKDKNEESV